jgi:hypothetical protein
VGGAVFPVTVTDGENPIDEAVQGPYLSVMRVSEELQVEDPVGDRFVRRPGFVIDQEQGLCGVGWRKEVAQGLSMRVSLGVIASDNPKTAVNEFGPVN